MSEETAIDYGPLAGLIGTWDGEKGLDVAPEPDGEERNPYYETITFTPIGDVTNADEQVLVGLHYREIVRRTSNDEVFHDQTGYWMWDAKERIVINSFVIPRGVAVVAGGKVDWAPGQTNPTTLDVQANLEDPAWSITQAPFMLEKATTTAFHQTLTLSGDTLSLSETTSLKIYGRAFEHTDENELTRQS